MTEAGGVPSAHVERPTRMRDGKTYCACGSPWPCERECGCPQDDGGNRFHVDGCPWFAAFIAGRGPSCARDCECVCHDTGGGSHDHVGQRCPGKTGQPIDNTVWKAVHE